MFVGQIHTSYSIVIRLFGGVTYTFFVIVIVFLYMLVIYTFFCDCSVPVRVGYVNIFLTESVVVIQHGILPLSRVVICIFVLYIVIRISALLCKLIAA